MKLEGTYLFKSLIKFGVVSLVLLALICLFFSEKGFQPLDVHLIKLVDDSCHEVVQLEETKISSSNRRIRLLGEEIRTPYKPFSVPYIIGA